MNTASRPPTQGGTRVEVVALFGPTASGKTAVAERVADALRTEVVSADAMQVYRGVPILTNQPERPTRLVAIREPHERMSAAEYARLAHAAIDDLVAVRGRAVVAGGTGLYLRAALTDLRIPPAPPPGARARLEALYDDGGAEAAHALLAKLDPAAARVVHPNDRRRVVRALELSETGASLVPEEASLWSADTRRPTLLVGIDVERDALATRIHERTLAMVERGALDEARRFEGASATARHVIGLDELRTLDLPDAVTAIDTRTRRYASYQRKWLRRLAPALVLDGLDDPDVSARRVLSAVREREATSQPSVAP